jgi:hypothetical protein
VKAQNIISCSSRNEIVFTFPGLESRCKWGIFLNCLCGFSDTLEIFDALRDYEFNFGRNGCKVYEGSLAAGP